MVRTRQPRRTNITGFFASAARIELGKRLDRSPAHDLGSNRRETGMRLRRSCRFHVQTIRSIRTSVPASISEVLDDRAQRSAGKKVSAPTMRITPTSSPTNSAPWSGRCRPGGTVFLPTIEPAIASTGTIIRKRPISIASAERDVVEGRVAVEPGEGRAVVAGRRGVGVEDLGEAVRPGVVRAATARPAARPRDRREAEDAISGKIRMASIASFISAPRSSCRGTPACGRPSGRR